MSIKWETRECAGCGKPLTRKPSRFRSDRAYCGPRCKATHTTHARQESKRDTQPCPNCGKPVTKYLSQIKSGAGWACSRHCGQRLAGLKRVREGTWVQPRRPRTGSMATCGACGKEFYQGPQEQRKYCSNACHNVGQTLEKTIKECEQCSATIILKPSQLSRRFCSHTCASISKLARPTGRSHNGKPVIELASGYLTIYEPDHPYAWLKGKRIFEHRHVMEKKLGRYLLPEEHVDHINAVKNDNREENLQVLSASEHSVKSNFEQKAQLERTLLEELQEYRRRFGALANE